MYFKKKLKPCYLYALAVFILYFFFISDITYAGGLTVITHGYRGETTNNWVSNMEYIIRERIEDELEAIEDRQLSTDEKIKLIANYTLKITDDPDNLSSYDYSILLTNGFYWGIRQETSVTMSESLTGHATVKLDWSDITLIGGTDGISTKVISEIACNALMNPQIASAFGGPLPIYSPIHLIGHSRGGSLVGALAEKFGEHGLWVDQATFLDPHPLELFNPLGEDDWGEDADMEAPGNVIFADNYYREGGIFYPNGEPIAQTFEVQLNEAYFDDTWDQRDEELGYENEHSDVHAWYRGTIPDLDSFPSNGLALEPDAVFRVTSDWYLQPAYDDGIGKPRDTVGYAYSLVANGGTNRPYEGIHSRINGSGQTRSFNPDLANIVAENVGYLALRETDVMAGDSVVVDFRYESWFLDFGVAFYLDDNQNPHDEHGPHLRSLLLGASDGMEGVNNPATLIIPPDQPTGTYYVMVRTIGSKAPRYFYAPTRLSVSNTASLPAKATNPSPIHESLDQTLNTNLAWQNGRGATSYDVYFGTDPSPGSGEYVDSQVSLIYDPPIRLEPNTDYFWRVDAKNAIGTTTGDVWRFTTGSTPGLEYLTLGGDNYNTDDESQCYETIPPSKTVFMNGETVYSNISVVNNNADTVWWRVRTRWYRPDGSYHQSEGSWYDILGGYWACWWFDYSWNGHQPPGAYSVVLAVNEQRASESSTGYKNVVEMPFTVRDKSPDITNVTVSNSSPYPGDIITVQATVDEAAAFQGQWDDSESGGVFNPSSVSVDDYRASVRTYSTNYTAPNIPGGTVGLRFTANNSEGSDLSYVDINISPYYGQTAAPTISPDGGTFTGSTQVILSSSTPGSTISYTIDGSSPDASSTKYTVPFTISSSCTVRARAFRSGYTDNDVSSATFIINPTSQVATPTISPNGGTFTSLPSITLSCSTPESTIRYTIDGALPTSDSFEYTEPLIIINNSFTLRARGFKSGYVESEIATAYFIFTQEEIPVLSVSPSSHALSHYAGTTIFTVDNTGTGTMPWTASVMPGASWLSISSDSNGTNEGFINVEASANTTGSSRTGTIRVTAPEANNSSIDVTVVQSASDNIDTDGDGEPDTTDTDDDNDGIDDETENAHPNAGDGNNDTIPDSLQNNVTALPIYNSQDYVALESAAGTTLESCEAVENLSPDNAPEDMEFPLGLLNFTINGVNPGGSTTLRLYFPSDITPDSYYKFSPATNGSPAEWFEFLYDGQTGAEINGNVVTLHFIDGGRGDQDFDGTNGVIVDPSGPGVLGISPGGGTPTGGGSSSGGGGGGCFIFNLTK